MLQFARCKSIVAVQLPCKFQEQTQTPESIELGVIDIILNFKDESLSSAQVEKATNVYYRWKW